MKSGLRNFNTLDLILSIPALFYDSSFFKIRVRSYSSKSTLVKNALAVA